MVTQYSGQVNKITLYTVSLTAIFVTVQRLTGLKKTDGVD